MKKETKDSFDVYGVYFMIVIFIIVFAALGIFAIKGGNRVRAEAEQTAIKKDCEVLKIFTGTYPEIMCVYIDNENENGIKYYKILKESVTDQDLENAVIKEYTINGSNVLVIRNLSPNSEIEKKSIEIYTGSVKSLF